MCPTCASRGTRPPGGSRPAEAVRALRDGEPSIGTRAEGDALVIGVWMMQPGDDKVVARRLREVLQKEPGQAGQILPNCLTASLMERNFSMKGFMRCSVSSSSWDFLSTSAAFA